MKHIAANRSQYLRRPVSVLFKLMMASVVVFAFLNSASAQTAIPPSGSGTEGDPYRITVLGNLVWMGDTVGSSFNKYYKVMNDIDASETASWDGGKGFVPIGDDTTQFMGVFDGNNKKITGLTINRPDREYVGLFGKIVGSQVKNLGLEDLTIAGGEFCGGLIGSQDGVGATVSDCYSSGDVSGTYSCGGLVGHLYEGPISNCYSSGSVSATADECGGLLGAQDRGSVSNCHSSANVSGRNNCGGLFGTQNRGSTDNSYATGDVSGEQSCGGLVGFQQNGSVSNCYSSGSVSCTGSDCGGLFGTYNGGSVGNCYSSCDVSGSGYCGGLVGSQDSDGSVSNCYSTGSVSATGNNCGGLVGRIYSGSVSNCYSTGSVSASNYRGGLVGYRSSSGTVSDSYYDTETSGQSDNTGKGTPKTTAEMKEQATFSGWDFTAIWGIKEKASYPYLLGLTPLGSLQVTLLPAEAVTVGAQWSVDNGATWNDSGTTVTDLPAADYTVTYNTIPGWTSPAPQPVTITKDDTTTASGTYVLQTGALQVTLFPAEAVTAGAQWSVDNGGTWNDSGTTVTDLPAADYTVTYNTIPGWTSPAPQTVTITKDDTTTASGTYVLQTGSLRVTLLPAEAVAAGAQWSINGGGTWNDSGVTVTGLPVGDYTVTFKTIPDWGNPAPQTVTITKNVTTTMTGTYVDSAPKIPSGSGTAEDPYQITVVGNLVWMGDTVAESPGKYYKVMNDIDASETAFWDGGKGFAPIGDNTTSFMGIFDGNNKKITGLTINRPDTDYIGLFGMTYVDATVKDLGLEDCFIVGSWCCGGLAGAVAALSSSTLCVTNCYMSGSVSGTSNNCGGLIGYQESCAISDCYSAVSVFTTSSYRGGLVGCVSSGSISKCHSTGDVTGETASFSGGLVGSLIDSSISNSYSTAGVNGNFRCGGLVGSQSNGTISNCYATGSVTANFYLGGLVGYKEGGSVSDCYYDKETSGQTDNTGKGTPKTTAEMKQQATFSAWDFASIWGIRENESYPYLVGLTPLGSLQVTLLPAAAVTAGAQWSINGGVTWNDSGATVTDLPVTTYTVTFKTIPDRTTPAPRPVTITKDVTTTVTGIYIDPTPKIPSGSGTEGDPYLITVLGNLVWMSNTVTESSDKYYKVMNDIDASETAGWDNGKGFVPIGENGEEFKGFFDGNNKKITGLTINRPDTDYIGLFGMTFGSQVKSLGLEDCTIAGSWHCGGLIGTQDGASATVKDCYVSGDVSGIDRVGGLVGYQSYGSISDCYTSGSVSATSENCGGLVGYTYYGNVSDCYTSGSVSCTGNNCGGLIGALVNGSVSNCYSSGSVSARRSCGGLVGTRDRGTVSNCHSSCRVSATGDNCGGLVGTHNMGSTDNSYATGDVSGRSYCGGLIGYQLNGSVSNCYSIGSVSGTGDDSGGLIGYHNGGSVSNCYATGSVSGTGNYCGGLAGSQGGDGSISNCYSTGSVSGTGWCGGLAGYQVNGSISNCYSTGSVSGSSRCGGLVGYRSSGTVSDSYYDTETSGQSDDTGKGTPKTTAEMKEQATFSGWDFTAIWGIKEKVSYPYLLGLTPLGSLQVTLLPADAVTSGAQWSINGGATWNDSGTTVTDLPAADYTVTYNTIPGWTSPEPQTVTITKDDTTTASGTYVLQTGTLQVTLLPAEAVTSGALWSIDGGTIWYVSGTIMVDLPVGDYTVTYKTIPSWTTPAPQPVTITKDGTTTASGTYVLQTGSLRVTLLPAEAVAAGAQWSINGGATWNDSGVTVTDLPVTTYTVTYKTIPDWTTPAPQPVTITEGVTTIMIGGYIPTPKVPSGSGTEEDPYLITVLGNLVWMGDTVTSSSGKFYKMMNDIDAAQTAGWDGSKGFVPIGSNATPFEGTFEGNNKKITGLTINRPDRDYVGLFGRAQIGSTIKNLGLEDFTIAGGEFCGGLTGGVTALSSSTLCVTNCYTSGSVSGGNYSGGLVGYQEAGFISDCYSVGSVNGGDACGGLIGYQEAGSISDCYSAGSVSGGNYSGGLVGCQEESSISNCYSSGSISCTSSSSGGLVGYQYGGSISDCYSSGNVSGVHFCGGLVGWPEGNASINNCYSTGSVSGNNYCGGLAGAQVGGSISNCYSTGSVSCENKYCGGLAGAQVDGSISNCYSTGSVSGNDSCGGLVGDQYHGSISNCYSTGHVSGTALCGGLIGSQSEETTVTDCYYDTETSGQSDTGKGTPKTTAEMKQQATFSGWDFAAIWGIKENESYPYLVGLTPLGSLRVTLLPAASVTAGAQWSINGGVTWHDSDATMDDLPVADYTVTYKTIADWTSPEPQTVTITGGDTTTASGTYISQFGSLQVTLLPAEAVTAGAQWSIDGGVTWRASGATVTGLPVADYTVTFKTITDWTSPEPQTVTITGGDTTTAVGTYVPQFGSLQVTLLPAEAVTAGAQWSMDGGATWRASGATVTGLSPADYTVTYKTITGWTSPAPVSVTVTAGATSSITGTYALKTFTITSNCGPNGTISPKGVYSVNYGSNKTYTITPNEFCSIREVRVDGVNVGAVTSYTCTIVTENHTIVATVHAPLDIVLLGGDFTAGTDTSLAPGAAVDLSWTVDASQSVGDPVWFEVFGSRTGGFDLVRTGAALTSSYKKQDGLGAASTTVKPGNLRLNPVPDGLYTLVPSVNRGNLPGAVGEGDYTNNWLPIAGKRLSVHNPNLSDIDLVLSDVDMQYDPAFPTRVTFRGKILNVGSDNLVKPGCWIEVFYGTLTAEEALMPQGTIGAGVKIETLAAGGSAEFTLSGTVPAGVKKRALAVVADSTDIVPAIDETNNVHLTYDPSVLPAGKTNGVDLAITGMTVDESQLAPNIVAPGEKLNFTVTVQNKGTVAPSGKVYLEVFASQDGGLSNVPGITVTWSEQIIPPALGATKTYTLSKPLNSIGDGMYTLVATVNRTGLGANPGDETPLDNRLKYAAGRIFLKTPTVSGTANIEWTEGPTFTQNGAQMTVTGTIKNTGTAATRAFWTEAFIGTVQAKTGVFYKDTNLVFCAGDNCPGLAAGATRNISLTGTVPSGKVVGVLADSTDVVAETDETDNYDYSGLTN